MWKLTKRGFALLFALLGFALILNLKIAGRPARDWAYEAWQNPTVQHYYQNIRSRVTAVLDKDISVEDAFSSDFKPKTDSGAKP